MVTLKTKKFGWCPDLPDTRDFQGNFYKVAASIPPVVDLRQTFKAIPVFNQGQIGSCVGNACAAAFMADYITQYRTVTMVPSRLFLYYNARAYEGNAAYDSGCQIRSCIKGMANLGSADEKLWAYVPTRFKSKPTAASYKQALTKQILEYRRLDNSKLESLLSCLASGMPFVFGFSVYESFEHINATGQYNPNFTKEELLGGHAVLAMGYSLETKKILVRNSWGPSWGKGGYFYMNFDEITNTNLADDFWVIRRAEQ